MKKNILIFMHNYTTQFIDIANQYSKVFDRALYHVTVAYLSGEPSDAIRQQTVADEVLFMNCSKSVMRGLKIGVIQECLKLCRARQFAMVICHRYKPTYIMLWVARWCHIPSLLFVMHELGTMRHLTRQWLVTFLQQKNMMFAGVSNAFANDLRQDLSRFP